MASIDIINAAGFAYKKTWAERNYLIPMIIVPLLVKYFCFTLSDIMVDGDNLLRMSMIMIPAYFAEGWLLAHWARTIMVGHRWPFKLSGDDAADKKAIKERARGVLSGTLAFVLINVLMGGYFSFFLTYIPMDMNPEKADPMVVGVGMIMIVSTFLLYRFIWSYIPLASNITPMDFFKKVKPMGVTFSMIGVWLVCFIPSLMALQFIGGFLGGMMEEGADNILLENLINFVHISVDMIKNLICTAGMAFALMALFQDDKP